MEPEFTNREINLMLGSINDKLKGILEHVMETNGRVHKLEVVTDHLEREMEKRDSNLEKLIVANEAKMKHWVLKALIIVTLAGSVIWIKESREVILNIIKAII